MRRPSDRLWIQNHPLLGNPCPVTGLQAYVDKDWVVQELRYNLWTGVLERGVILSFPVGYTRMAGTNRFFANMQKILDSGRVDRDNFVLIEDYSLHTGSDYEGRLTYIGRMVNEVKPTAVIFVTNSTFWRLSIRLGHALGRNAMPVVLASSYRHALQLASKYLGRTLPGLDRSNGVAARTEWNSATFRFTCKVEEQTVLTATYQGKPDDIDIAESVAIFRNCLEDMAEKSDTLKSVIHDMSALQLASPRKARRFMFGMRLATQHIDVHRVVMVTRNIPLRAFLWALSKTVSPVVRVATDMAHAQEIVNTKAALTDKALVDGALRLVESVQWDSASPPLSETLDEHSPFHDLAIALDTVKQDMDHNLAARESELAEIEQTNQRFVELSSEIEAALQRSEQDRTQLARMSERNKGLVMEIGQTRREILSVLSTFVDTRSAEAAGYSSRIADEAVWLGKKVGMAAAELEQLFDAALLHHVGFLGIPEIVIQNRQADAALEALYREHTLIGAQVLGRIEAALSRFAPQVAMFHHEHWDGTGYPSGLAGEAIPQEARIVAAATVLVRLLEEHVPVSELSGRLESLRGTVLDPILVDYMLERITAHAGTSR